MLVFSRLMLVLVYAGIRFETEEGKGMRKERTVI
jgi:hypothetical protein